LTWLHDHETSNFPWNTSVAQEGNLVPLGFGGTNLFVNPSLERNKVYWQFAFISNELSNPKVLVCPADRGVGAPRKLAKSFGADPKNSGLMAPGFRDQACSYTIALDVVMTTTGFDLPNLPQI